MSPEFWLPEKVVEIERGHGKRTTLDMDRFVLTWSAPAILLVIDILISKFQGPALRMSST